MGERPVTPSRAFRGGVATTQGEGSAHGSVHAGGATRVEPNSVEPDDILGLSGMTPDEIRVLVGEILRIAAAAGGHAPFPPGWRDELRAHGFLPDQEDAPSVPLSEAPDPEGGQGDGETGPQDVSAGIPQQAPPQPQADLSTLGGMLMAWGGQDAVRAAGSITRATAPDLVNGIRRDRHRLAFAGALAQLGCLPWGERDWTRLRVAELTDALARRLDAEVADVPESDAVRALWEWVEAMPLDRAAATVTQVREDALRGFLRERLARVKDTAWAEEQPGAGQGPDAAENRYATLAVGRINARLTADVQEQFPDRPRRMAPELRMLQRATVSADARASVAARFPNADRAQQDAIADVVRQVAWRHRDDWYSQTIAGLADEVAEHLTPDITVAHYDPKLGRYTGETETLRHTAAGFLYPDARWELWDVHEDITTAEDLENIYNGGKRLRMANGHRMFASDQDIHGFADESSPVNYGALLASPCLDSIVKTANVLIIDHETGQNDIGLDPEVAKRLVGDCRFLIREDWADALTGTTAAFQHRMAWTDPPDGTGEAHARRDQILKGTALPVAADNLVFTVAGVPRRFDIVVPTSGNKGRKDGSGIQLGACTRRVWIGYRALAEERAQRLGPQVGAEHRVAVATVLTPRAEAEASKLAAMQSDLPALERHHVETVRRREREQQEHKERKKRTQRGQASLDVGGDYEDMLTLDDVIDADADGDHDHEDMAAIGDVVDADEEEEERLDAAIRAGRPDAEQQRRQPVREVIEADLAAGHLQLVEQPFIEDAVKKSVKDEWRRHAFLGDAKIRARLAQPSLDLARGEVCVPGVPHGALIYVTRSPLLTSDGLQLYVNNLELPKLAKTMPWMRDAMLRQNGAIFLHPDDAAECHFGDFDGDYFAYTVVDPRDTLAYALGHELATLRARERGEDFPAIDDPTWPELAREQALRLGHERAEKTPGWYVSEDGDAIVYRVPEGMEQPATPPERGWQHARFSKLPKLTRNPDDSVAKMALDAMKAKKMVGILANDKGRLRALRDRALFIPPDEPERRAKYAHKVAKYAASLCQDPAAFGPLRQHFELRLRALAPAAAALPEELSPTEVDRVLDAWAHLLLDAEDVVAFQLQIAVDSPKSGRPTNDKVRDACRLLSGLEPVESIDRKREADAYVNGPLLQGTYDDPPVDPNTRNIWAIDRLFEECQIGRRPAAQFADFFHDVTPTRQDRADGDRIYADYMAMVREAVWIAQRANKREGRVGPAMVATVSRGGGEPMEIDIVDLTATSAAWEAARGNPPILNIAFRHDRKTNALSAVVAGTGKHIGTVSKRSVDTYRLTARDTLDKADVTLLPPAKREQATEKFRQARQYLLDEYETLPEDRRRGVTAYLWQRSHMSHAESPSLASKVKASVPFLFGLDEVIAHLQELQFTRLDMVGLNHQINEYGSCVGLRDARFKVVLEQDESNHHIHNRRIIAIRDGDEWRTLGELHWQSAALPIGTEFTADAITPEVVARTPNGTPIRIINIEKHELGLDVREGRATLTIGFLPSDDPAATEPVPAALLDGKVLGTIEPASVALLRRHNKLAEDVRLEVDLTIPDRSWARLRVHPESVTYPDRWIPDAGMDHWLWDDGTPREETPSGPPRRKPRPGEPLTYIVGNRGRGRSAFTEGHLLRVLDDARAQATARGETFPDNNIVTSSERGVGAVARAWADKNGLPGIDAPGVDDPYAQARTIVAHAAAVVVVHVKTNMGEGEQLNKDIAARARQGRKLVYEYLFDPRDDSLTPVISQKDGALIPVADLEKKDLRIAINFCNTQGGYDSAFVSNLPGMSPAYEDAYEKWRWAAARGMVYREGVPFAPGAIDPIEILYQRLHVVNVIGQGAVDKDGHPLPAVEGAIDYNALDFEAAVPAALRRVADHARYLNTHVPDHRAVICLPRIGPEKDERQQRLTALAKEIFEAQGIEVRWGLDGLERAPENEAVPPTGREEEPALPPAVPALTDTVSSRPAPSQDHSALSAGNATSSTTAEQEGGASVAAPSPLQDANGALPPQALRTIITGSRGMIPQEVVWNILSDARDRHGLTIGEVVSGRARGIERTGEAWAEEQGLPCEPFNVDERDAAMVDERDAAMSAYAEAAVVVHSGAPDSHPKVAALRTQGLLVHEYVVDPVQHTWSRVPPASTRPSGADAARAALPEQPPLSPRQTEALKLVLDEEWSLSDQATPAALCDEISAAVAGVHTIATRPLTVGTTAKTVAGEAASRLFTRWMGETEQGHDTRAYHELSAEEIREVLATRCPITKKGQAEAKKRNRLVGREMIKVAQLLVAADERAAGYTPMDIKRQIDFEYKPYLADRSAWGRLTIAALAEGAASTLGQRRAEQQGVPLPNTNNGRGTAASPTGMDTQAARTENALPPPQPTADMAGVALNVPLEESLRREEQSHDDAGGLQGQHGPSPEPPRGEGQGDAAQPGGQPEDAGITYVVGDAARPDGTGPRVILNIVNDVGAWGAGFSSALSDRWPPLPGQRDQRDRSPEQHYRARFNAWLETERARKPWGLGEGQIVEVEPDIYVINLIAQRDVRRHERDKPPSLADEALRSGLARVARFAREKGASVHMPRLADGLATGTWDRALPLLRDELVNNVNQTEQPIAVYVYDRPAPLLTVAVIGSREGIPEWQTRDGVRRIVAEAQAAGISADRMLIRSGDGGRPHIGNPKEYPESVDLIAIDEARRLGARTEVWPPVWTAHDPHTGKVARDGQGRALPNPRKGVAFDRDGLIIEGADVVVAFKREGSRGTEDTIQKAHAAGIATQPFTPLPRTYDKHKPGAQGIDVSRYGAGGYGNPFIVLQRMTRGDTLYAHALYALDRLTREPAWLQGLAGKHVTCFCHGPEETTGCHADTLKCLADPNRYRTFGDFPPNPYLDWALEQVRIQTDLDALRSAPQLAAVASTQAPALRALFERLDLAKMAASPALAPFIHTSGRGRVLPEQALAMGRVRAQVAGLTVPIATPSQDPSDHQPPPAAPRADGQARQTPAHEPVAPQTASVPTERANPARIGGGVKEFGVLHNFSSSGFADSKGFLYRGWPWRTSEHCFQAMKFFPTPDDPPDLRSARRALMARIQATHDPTEAKALARSPEARRLQRTDWEQGEGSSKLCIRAMQQIVMAKLEQNPTARELLLSTGEREIVEVAPRDDASGRFWGRTRDGRGDNWMGQILMEARTRLQEQARTRPSVMPAVGHESASPPQPSPAAQAQNAPPQATGAPARGDQASNGGGDAPTPHIFPVAAQYGASCRVQHAPEDVNGRIAAQAMDATAPVFGPPRTPTPSATQAPQNETAHGRVSPQSQPAPLTGQHTIDRTLRR